MRTLMTAIGEAWDALNPAEPSPAYLAKIMAGAVFLFTLALIIGPII